MTAKEHIHRHISLVFLGLLVVSFVLWYIVKLSHAYTALLPFTVNIDGSKARVECLVEGQGTNLLGYRVYSNRGVKVPLSELRFRRVRDRQGWLRIDSVSLVSALSTRLSDVRVLEVDRSPEIEDPRLKP